MPFVESVHIAHGDNQKQQKLGVFEKHTAKGGDGFVLPPKPRIDDADHDPQDPGGNHHSLDLRRLVASSLMTIAYAAAKTAREANPTQAPARSGLSPEAATAGCGAINAAPAIDPRFRPPPFRHPQAVGRVEAFAGAEKPSTPAPTTPDSTEPTSTPSRITVS